MNKKVFISYSWDSVEHKNWVLQLADTLIDNGVDVLVDQYDIADGESITQFMEKAIIESDHTLVILTQNYKIKSLERKGGVGYEQQIISGEILAGNNIKKFIPLIREGEFKGVNSSIPPHFSGIKTIDFRSTENKNATEQLLRSIYEKPKLVKPKLGIAPDFAETKPKKVKVFKIDLDEEFKLTKSELSFTNDLIEIADLKKKNIPHKIEIRVGNLSNLISEFNGLQEIDNPTDKEIERKLDLRQILNIKFYWTNGTLYEYLQKSLELIIKYSFNQHQHIIYPNDLYTAVKKCFEFYNENRHTGTGFDVFNNNLKWGFKIYIDDNEVEKLQSVFGFKDKGLLTAIAGLDTYDLSHETVVDELIPRISMRYTRDIFHSRVDKEKQEEYLIIGNYRIGLA